MSEVDLDRLRMVPLFAEVDDERLAMISAAGTEFEVEGGYVLAEHGQPGSGMFVILEGTVEVEVPNAAPVALGPGEFFGELALLADTERAARVRAVTPVRGLAIDRAAFGTLLREEPHIALAMLPVLARRLAAVESAR
jgi:voltage-gated potassium channel